MNSPRDDYCTTRQAATRLGISLGTVQQMVESGTLRGWKTSGGHRRVSIASVNELLRQRIVAAGNSLADGYLQVLVVEDDADLQRLYKATFLSWGMPLNLEVLGNGFDALMRIGLNPPDVLITDLMMTGLDGFEMIHRLRQNHELSDMDIIVVTGISAEEARANNRLPEDVTLYVKPIPFAELRGYLRAILVQRHRQSLPVRNN